MDNIEKITLDKLIPYINNARTHDEAQVAQIAASIKEFGFTNPILIDNEYGIIAGHGRLMAAKKLGLKEVPTIMLNHLTETQRKAYILADNRIALNAGWDNELLALELQELDDLTELDFNLDLTGFSEIELANLIGVTADEVGLPELRDGDKEPFQQMTFMLHDEQAEQVSAAITIAKAMGEFTESQNENSNGNAIARICEMFITQNV